jgi:hypothetical protein
MYCPKKQQERYAGAWSAKKKIFLLLGKRFGRGGRFLLTTLTIIYFMPTTQAHCTRDATKKQQQEGSNQQPPATHRFLLLLVGFSILVSGFLLLFTTRLCSLYSVRVSE